LKSYIINLAGAVARLERMTTSFGACGIKFERFYAVTGHAARSDPAFSLMPRPKHRRWSDGELGCLFSHFEIWRRIAAGPESFAAVFEDDIHLSPLLRGFLDAPAPPEADIIKLETHSLTSYRSAATEHRAGVGLHRLVDMHYGTAGYVLSRMAAATLVSRQRYFDVPVDHILFEPLHRANAGFKIYQCVPGLVIQDDALPEAQRWGGALGTAMTERVNTVKARPLLERLSRFPRSGARRIERLIFPVTVEMIPFEAVDT